MSTWGWQSHLYSLVPLGWALQAAGHEVRVASHPSMATAISSAGLAAVPLGPDIDFAETFTGVIGKVGRLDELAPARAPDEVEPAITADGGTVRLADALLDEMVAFGRGYRPDLMIWEPFNLAAAVASRALGVPGVQQLWGPDSSVTLRLDPEAVFGPMARRFGVSPADVRPRGDLMLDPVPAPLQVPLSGPSQPIRFVPYNGTAIVPDWLREPPERTRVCFTAGTMMAGVGLKDRMDLPGAIRAVAELDVEVVVAVEPAQHASLGTLPGNVRLVRSRLAIRLVLPSCAALVQQGGASTLMTALTYGVPQLILPQVSDQHFNGERLAGSGAGTWLSPGETSVEVVRDTVADLIAAPHWREAAELMSDRIRRAPSPAEVVAVLEALAAGDSPQGADR